MGRLFILKENSKDVNDLRLNFVKVFTYGPDLEIH